MRPLVRVVLDGDDSPALTRRLNRLHRPDRKVTVVRPTPGRGGQGIARDVLRALGKRFDITRTPRDPAALAALANVWLRAERTDTVVATRAHRLPAGDWQTLCSILRTGGPGSLWLVAHEPNLGDDHRALLARRRWEQLPVGELFDRLRPSPADEANSEPDAAPDYPAVPDADFPFFLSACHDRLEETDRGRILATFGGAREETRRWLDRRRESTTGEIATYLDGLIAPCATTDAALARLHGAQASLFLAGILVTIDPGQLSAARAARPHTWLTRPVSELLRAYTEPTPAALAAVAALTGYGPPPIARLVIDDIDRDASELTGGYPIPAHARALIRAHLLTLEASDHEPGGPLFHRPGQPERPASARMLAGQLERVSYQTGLEFDTRHAWRASSRRSHAWANIAPVPALADDRA